LDIIEIDRAMGKTGVLKASTADTVKAILSEYRKVGGRRHYCTGTTSTGSRTVNYHFVDE
jgi:hypothetical protein